MPAPTLLVKLDDGTGTFPYDISVYVRQVGAQVEVERGRPNEGTDVDAGRLSLRLDNTDGRFTLGDPTYGVRRGQRIRVTLAAGVTTVHVITAYVQDWPTVFAGPRAVMTIINVVARDLQLRLGRRTLRSMLEEEVLLDDPLAYYTLAEPAGSVAGGDTSGNGQPPLVQVGAGTAVTFGTGTAPGPEAATAAQITGGKYLAAVPNVAAASGNSLVIECWFSRFGVPAPQSDRLVRVWDPTLTTLLAEMFVFNTGGLLGFGVPGGSLFSAAAVTDGALHHAALCRTATGGFRAYLDGALVGSSAPGATPPGVVGLVEVGGSSVSGTQTAQATIASVAIYNDSQGATNFDAPAARHAASGIGAFAGETTDARVARLAGYAGLAAGNLALEAGVETVPAQTTSGTSVLDALRAVSRAEGGAMFVGGDGKLVLQNRAHRVIAATGTPDVTLAGDAGEVEWEDLLITGDDQYLVNVAEGSRIGGATQRVTNPASIVTDGEYPAENLAGLLVMTDDDVVDRLRWVVAVYGDPGERMAQVTVDLLTAPVTLQEAVLALEVGDHIVVADLPALSPLADAELVIEGIRYVVSQTEFKVTFNTAPAQLFRAWVLGDATYGALGITTRLHY
ncbi:hypothetical protein GCM10009795_039950 [Nocardioides hankookensis]|uniref:LamG-like jellyroll fold domain-containing protein n=1 Tax=Nocardioides hankookensis TaxID=443157 RepID=A0ABW1LQN0_9ACTN